MQLIKRTIFETIHVFDGSTERNQIVATFNNQKIYDMFKSGLPQFRGVSLYDDDAGQYVVGTLDELTSNLAHTNEPGLYIPATSPDDCDGAFQAGVQIMKQKGAQSMEDRGLKDRDFKIIDGPAW